MASSSEISPRSTHPSHLQTSLVNFVVANRTAVTSMMNPPKTDLKPFETYFLDLPAEIRCMIYKYVFDGAILKLHYHLQHAHIERGKLRLQPVSIDDIITHISDYKGALLRVSAFCKQEALYILASCTTIVFEHQDNQREDLLDPIDHDFLRHVRGVQMLPDAFIHTNRKLLPNLKEVVLSYNVGGPCGRISIRAWFHSLACSTCGDPTGFMSYEKINYELWDWNWKRKQLLYLAEENHWQIKLVLYQDYLPDGPANFDEMEHFDIRFEHEYNLQTEQFVSRRLFKDDEEILKDADFYNMAKLVNAGLRFKA